MYNATESCFGGGYNAQDTIMDHIHNNSLNNAHRTPGVLELEQLPTHFCMKNTALFACCCYAYTIRGTCLLVSPREQSSGK